MPARRYAILEAPSSLGLATDGVEDLPARLLELGLAGTHPGAPCRAARRSAEAMAPLTPKASTLNATAIAAWSPRLADAVEAVLDAGEFPVVLGGDCTIVLGLDARIATARPLWPVLHRRPCRFLPARGGAER